MYVKCNPNPLGKAVGDCVVRAIAVATRRSWRDAYWKICEQGDRDCDMPSSNPVWGNVLKHHGFRQMMLPETCPECVTVRAFASMYPEGVYVIGTGTELYPLNTRCCAPVTACSVRTRTKYATRVVTSAAGAVFRMLGSPACSPDYSLASIDGTAPEAAAGN